MLNFGSLNSLPTPSTEYFWQFVGGAPAPANIDVKSGNGVTGIDASLPAETRLKLLLQDLGGGNLASGAFWIDFGAGEAYATGIEKIGAQVVNQMLYASFGGGIIARRVQNFLSRDNARIGDKEYVSEFNQSGVIETTGDNVTGNGTYRDSSETEQELNVQVGLNVVSRFIIKVLENRLEKFTANGNMFITQVENGGGAGADLIEMLLQDNGNGDNISVSVFKDYAFLQYADDPSGANNRMQVKARIDRAAVEFNDVETFAVKSDGKIQTNQVAAGVHVVPAGEMPVYDNAGVLKGYIQLFT